MKPLDCVEVIVEKGEYAREGVHKGMQGCIWETGKKGLWELLVPQYGEKEDIAYIVVREEDLKLLSNGMDARVNEAIKARFEAFGEE